MEQEKWRQIGLALVEELSEFARKTLAAHQGSAVERYLTSKSPVYGIDMQLENRAIDFLRRHRVNAILRSEDTGITEIGPRPEMVILLDPLDGSINAVRELPYYCVSAAIGSLSLQAKFDLKAVKIAIVKDLPRNKTYTAIRGSGAFLEGQPIGTSDCTVLGQALLAFYPRLAPSETVRLADQALSARTTGAAALELCDLARGTYDCFVDIRNRLKPTDIAAGALIAHEAGCTIDYTSSGSDLSPDSEKINLIASATLPLHQAVCQILGR
jgi:myo-inositol-1(or 4)-monophosphatase